MSEFVRRVEMMARTADAMFERLLAKGFVECRENDRDALMWSDKVVCASTGTELITKRFVRLADTGFVEMTTIMGDHDLDMPDQIPA